MYYLSIYLSTHPLTHTHTYAYALLFLFDKRDCSIVWQLATVFSSILSLTFRFWSDFTFTPPLPTPTRPSGCEPSLALAFPLLGRGRIAEPSSPALAPSLHYLSSLCMVMASVLFSSSIILQPEGCTGRELVAAGRCWLRLPYCSCCWIWEGRTAWWCWAPPCWPLFWAA